jgi:hypothetical protein
VTTTPGSPPRRTLVIALLVGLGLLVVAGLIALVLILAPQQQGGGQTPRPTITGLPGSARPTITPSPTGVPAPPGQDESVPSPDQRKRFQDAIESGNSAALAQDLADTVDLILAGSECCGPVSKQEALDGLAYVGPGSGASWNFSPDVTTLDALRAGENAEFFPPNAIVGISSNGYLLSFVPGPDQLVARILIGTVP